MWGLETGAELRKLVAHPHAVTSAAMTPDGLRAISASEDRTLKVWDLETGALLCTFHAETGVGSYGAALDGVTIVAGDHAGHMRFLRLESVPPSPPIITAWRVPAPRPPLLARLPFRFRPAPEAGPLAFGCLVCREWSEVRPSAPGTEIPCPHFGKPVKLDLFTIDAEWRPIARARQPKT